MHNNNLCKSAKNGPLGKFTRFIYNIYIYMHFNVSCITMNGVIKNYVIQIYATCA